MWLFPPGLLCSRGRHSMAKHSATVSRERSSALRDYSSLLPWSSSRGQESQSTVWSVFPCSSPFLPAVCLPGGILWQWGFFFQMKMNVSRTTEAAANFVLTWRTPTAASVGSGAHWEVMGKPVKVRFQLSQSVGNDINHSPSFAVLSWLLAAGIKYHSYHFCACQWGCYWNTLLIKRRGVSSLFSLPCSFLLGLACIYLHGGRGSSECGRLVVQTELVIAGDAGIWLWRFVW